MNLNDLGYFAKAVDGGGFAPAARRYGTPKSTISKRVAALSGKFVRVLPRWTAGQVTTTALVPHRRSVLPSVQAVLRFLEEQVGGKAPA